MGQFPFRLGQIEYAMEQMTAELDGTAQAQDELLDALEATTESSGVEREVEQQI
jgi:hypothetical protein